MLKFESRITFLRVVGESLYVHCAGSELVAFEMSQVLGIKSRQEAEQVGAKWTTKLDELRDAEVRQISCP